MDSSQTYLWKRILRNRRRLWNQTSEQKSEQGVEDDVLGYRPLNNRMVEIRDEGGNLRRFRQHATGGEWEWVIKLNRHNWNTRLIMTGLSEKEIRQEEILGERDLTTCFLFSILIWIKHISKRKGAGPYSREYVMRNAWRSDLHGYHETDFFIELDGYCKQLKLAFE